MPTAGHDPRSSRHETRVDALIGEHVRRKRNGIKHPVEDFLFTYYSYRPAQLRTWFPGFDRIPDPREVDRIKRIRELLVKTAERPAHLGCFGLHEWAMVYRTPDTRHPVPLRMSDEQLAAFVDSQKIRCSHFDAFRFFTPPARSLNLLSPTREAQTEFEQPGCLHANMDLYKASYKLAPLIPAEFIVDCFEFARDIRTLDMRASPYDLADLGYPPVQIETLAGRAEYVTLQRGFAERGAPLRDYLIRASDRLLAMSAETSTCDRNHSMDEYVGVTLTRT